MNIKEGRKWDTTKWTDDPMFWIMVKDGRIIFYVYLIVNILGILFFLGLKAVTPYLANFVEKVSSILTI